MDRRSIGNPKTHWAGRVIRLHKPAAALAAWNLDSEVNQQSRNDAKAIVLIATNSAVQSQPGSRSSEREPLPRVRRGSGTEQVSLIRRTLIA